MPEPSIDVADLIGEVAKRHGIALGKDDPAFAIVTLNRLVLQRFLDEVVDRIGIAVGEFDEAATRVQAVAGRKIGADVRDAAAAVREEFQKDVRDAGFQARELVASIDAAYSRPAMFRYVAMGLACGVILFVAGFLVGRYLR